MFISGTDLVYSQEETDQADPVTEDMGGQAGIKGAALSTWTELP